MNRLATTASAIVVAMAAAPAPAQTTDDPDHSTELELGGGWVLSDLLGLEDLTGVAGPAIDAAWTRWRGRSGIGFGAMAVFGLHDDHKTYFERGLQGPVPTVIASVPHIYAHANWRRRWIGGGPLIHQDRLGPGRFITSVAPVWHIEAMVTYEIREGLSARVGAESIQWLFVPLSLRASATIVWTF